jgi:hypothetical protein
MSPLIFAIGAAILALNTDRRNTNAFKGDRFDPPENPPGMG